MFKIENISIKSYKPIIITPNKATNFEFVLVIIDFAPNITFFYKIKSLKPKITCFPGPFFLFTAL